MPAAIPSPETSLSDAHGYSLSDLSFLDYGRGSPPVLVLHGWGGDEISLEVIGKPLSAHRRVLSPTLPGFGLSPEPPTPWGSSEYVELIVKWLAGQASAPAQSQVGQDSVPANNSVDLICHSFGARIAIGIAAKHPELVNRLVLMAGAGLRPPRSLRTRVRLLYGRSLKLTARLLGENLGEKVRQYRDRLGSSDWRSASPVMRGTLSKVVNEDLSEQCMQIRKPTLLIWGGEDRDTPLALGRKMNRLIPGSRLVAYPDAGHYVFLDKRGEVLSEIWKHLELPEAW